MSVNQPVNTVNDMRSNTDSAPVITPNSDKKRLAKDNFAQAVTQSATPNAFPVHVFPKRLQAVLLEMNKTLSFPVEYTGTSVLFAGCLAIGNAHRVRVKKGFVMPCTLWLAIVGKSGVSKSHPMKAMLTPFLDLDTKHSEQYKQDAQQYNRDLKTEDADESAKPALKKYLVQDFTLESLVSKHKDNPRGIGVFADELTSWTNNFDRYSQGSQEQTWLTSHGGGAFDFSRKSGDVRLPHSFLPVLGSTQIKSLPRLAANNRVHSGFLDRMLFAYNANDTAEYWAEDDLSDEIENDYHAIIGKLLEMDALHGANPNEPVLVDFEASAKKILFDWQKRNTDLLNISEDSERGIRAKLQTNVPRIALIMHFLEYACSESEYSIKIKDKTVLAAIELSDYFLESAKNVYSIITGEPVKDAKKDNEDKQIWALHLEGKSNAEISRVVYGTDKSRAQIGRHVARLGSQYEKNQPLKVVKKIA